MNWLEFKETAPEIAERGAQRLQRARVALLGTLRADGSPRISPVEPYFIPPHLVLGMIWQSKKALDLLRDPRCVLHSAITDPDANEGEFKLRARALDIAKESPYARLIREKWRIPYSTPLHVFALDILAASFTEYDFGKGEMIVQQWDPRKGTVETRRSYP